MSSNNIVIESGAVVNSNQKSGQGAVSVVAGGNVMINQYPQPEVIPETSNNIFKFIENGDLIKLRTLIDPKPALYINQINECGMSLIHVAAQHGHLEILTYLSKKGCNILAKCSVGRTALHYAASSGSVDLITYLNSFGIDINVEDNEKSTPIHFAAREGHLATIKELQHLGADIFEMSHYRWNSLHLASRYGHIDCVKYLVKAGLDVNSSN